MLGGGGGPRNITPSRNMVDFIITSLYGRFATIFYFNCAHVLFAYILKQNKNSRILSKKLFTNHPWGHVTSHTKFGPDRFQTFWSFLGYKQTERQAEFIYRCRKKVGTGRPSFYRWGTPE